MATKVSSTAGLPTTDHENDAWKELALSYASATQSATMPPIKTLLSLLNEQWPLSKATSILDTGCGPGAAMDALLREFGSQIPQAAKLRAADASPAMIEQVKAKKEREIGVGNTLWQRVQVDVMDAQELAGLEDGSVSHVTGSFVFMLVPEPRKALAATRRVLTSENGGGVLALSAWLGSEWIDLMQLVRTVRPDKELFSLPAVWQSVEGVKGELEATGYRDVRAVAVDTEMAFEDHEGVVRFFTTKIPHMREYAKDMTEEEVKRLEQLMVEQLRRLHPVAPGRMKGTAIVAVGRK